VSALETFDGVDPAKAGWFAGDTSAPTMKCSALTILTGPRGNQKVPNVDSISKTYEKLPAHTQVRIQATAHFVDDFQGEMVYLKVDNNIAWTDTHDQRASRGQFSVCGSEVYPESRFSVPIDVTFSHSAPRLKVSFGSTLDNTAVAAFGISSFTLSIRDMPPKHHGKGKGDGHGKDAKAHGKGDKSGKDAKKAAGGKSTTNPKASVKK